MIEFLSLFTEIKVLLDLKYGDHIWGTNGKQSMVGMFLKVNS